jgi:hypothetical protein
MQHDAIEFFGARPNEPIETCLHEVRRSDVPVVVVGHRYGTLISKQPISFTEAEYREGYRLDKPCFIYIRRDDVPVLPEHFEQDPGKLRSLKRFKTVLTERHTVAWFSDSQDLCVQVVADLGFKIELLRHKDQGGHVAVLGAPTPGTVGDQIIRTQCRI